MKRAVAYFAVIPYPVRASRMISNDEKLLYCELSARLEIPGYCKSSNKDLSMFFAVSERTITCWLTHLKEAGFIRIVQNNRKHRRQIYLCNLATPKDEEKPEMLSEAQALFKQEFPERRIDIADIPANVNMELLIYSIKKSDFLSKAKNLGLKWCIDHYKQIVSGGYETFTKGRGNFKQRKISYEEQMKFEEELNEIQEKLLKGEIDL